MFLSYLFFSFGLKRIPASQAMTLASVKILVAALLTMVLLGESLSLTSYIGLISIFLYVFLLAQKWKINNIIFIYHKCISILSKIDLSLPYSFLMGQIIDLSNTKDKKTSFKTLKFTILTACHSGEMF